jgi:phage anti-repressor protein
MSNNSKALLSESRQAGMQDIPFIKDGDNLLVDARLLHQKLKSKREFATWIKSQIADYGFEENKDFLTNLSKSTGGRKSKEFHLTLDTAKEIAMVSKTEAGRQIRRFFIEKEKELRNLRLYGQKVNLSELRRNVEVRRINGYTMYPLRKVQTLLGYSTKSSTANVKRRFDGLLVVMDNTSYVAEQYVQVLVARATARAKTAEAMATAPVLPVGFGQMPSLFDNPKTNK